MPDAKTVLRMIRADMEADIVRFEGKPFTGRNVATMFGNQAAAICALADIVGKMIEDES